MTRSRSSITTNQDTVVPNNDQPNVYLNHAVLDLVSFGNAAPEPGSVYTLISNPAGGPVLGVFKYQDQNLNEGGTVTIDGMPFVISYHGGAANDNDVILYNVANTLTTVASLTGGSTYGQMVTLEHYVAGVQTTLMPTGVVDFSIGEGTLIGSVERSTPTATPSSPTPRCPPARRPLPPSTTGPTTSSRATIRFTRRSPRHRRWSSSPPPSPRPPWARS